MTNPATSSAASVAAAPSGLLVIDKTRGPTSHDVVAVARRVLGTKAIGHTGTLDPMATGALILVVGEATKLVTLLGAEAKRYRTTIRFGVATHTLDAEGDVVEERPVGPLNTARVHAALNLFLGEIAQVPPQVSAIKVDGQTAHQRARRGEVVALAARNVRLDAFEVHAVRDAEVDVSLTCGKGFYVRALARDLAAALDTVAHLTGLRREENAGFPAAGAVTFDALLHAAKVDVRARADIVQRVQPLPAICARLPRLVIADEGIAHLRVGRPSPTEYVRARFAAEGAECVALDERGQPHAIARETEGVVRVLRGINPG